MAELDNKGRVTITYADFKVVAAKHVDQAIREYLRGDPKTDYKRFGHKARTRWIWTEGGPVPLKTISARAFEIASGQTPKSSSLITNEFQRHLTALEEFEFISTKVGEAPRLPNSEKHRERRIAEILSRPEQSRFREAVLQAYNFRCAVTGNSALPALEAAHIRPVRENGSDLSKNGIALRADLHRLFDASLMAIDPATMVVHFAPDVAESYRDAEGTQMRSPEHTNAMPDQTALDDRWALFARKHLNAR
ncbi:MAG: HNH endonuclease signature motif containing protein [Limibaculum sp.]